MNAIQPTRRERHALEKENKSWPIMLTPFPRHLWSETATKMTNAPVEVWRSRGFLCQIFAEANGIERLTVCRTEINGASWKADITWDDLQRLKSECGRGDKMAVEIYPPDCDVVNVANMRHLWVLTESLPFGWRRK